MNMEYDDNIITFAKSLKRTLEDNFKGQMKSELETLKSQPGKFSLEEIENNYREQISKIKRIETLMFSNDIASLQQIRNIYMLAESLNVKPAKKDALVATLIALCAKEGLNISNLTVQEAYLLCNVMINVSLKSYGMYDKIIGTPSVLNTTIKKTDMLTEQLDILEEVLRYCEENGYDGMDNERYENAVVDCLGIISMYNIANIQEDIQNIKI